MFPSELIPARSWRLAEYFERLYLPTYLIESADGTIAIYRTMLKWWSFLTPDPPLRRIDQVLLAGFKRGLVTESDSGRPSLFPADPSPAGRDKVGKATASKYIRHLNAMLGKAGPPGHRNRDALGILEAVPWVREFKKQKPRPRAVPALKLDAVYRSTVAAEYPRLAGVRAEHWWKALIVTAYTTGFRHGQPRPPKGPAGLLGLPADAVEWESARICMPAGMDKCDEERVKPLHPIVVQHLLRIRGIGERLFQWPHSERTWYRQWHRIQDAAGLVYKKDKAKNQHIGLHDLKRTCGTTAAKLGSAWVVQDLLDHSSLNTSQHYVDPTDEVRAVVARWPMPPAVLEEFGAEEDSA